MREQVETGSAGGILTSLRGPGCNRSLRKKRPIGFNEGNLVSDYERHYDAVLLHKQVSWPAIFAGVVLAITIQLLPSMLGLSIGLGMVNTNVGNTPNASSFGIGTESPGLETDRFESLCGDRHGLKGCW